MQQSYWDSTGKFQIFIEQLQGMIPASGSVEFARSKNKKLERFRTASNAYYDLFNNGGMNRMNEIRRIFGLCHRDFYYGSSYKCRQRPNFNKAAAIVDPIMDLIVLEAVVEQGICDRESAESMAIILA